MRQRIPGDFSRVGDSVNPFVLCSSSGSLFEIHFLDDDVVRVLHRPPTAGDSVLNAAASHIGTGLVLLNDFNRTIQPQLIHSGFLYILETRSLSIEIDLEDKDFKLSWTWRDASVAFLEDLPFRAYEYDLGGGSSHYIKTRDEDIHYGLGERTSPLALNGRRFRLECCDALGYNSETTDPLYKLVPYYLTMNKKTRHAFGVYYDTLCTGSMDFGCEIDALWGNYRVFRSQQTYLDYYVFHGPSLAKCVSTFAKLVGRPAMVPKYALGYLASSMGYAEAENAQELIEAFPALCQKWDIPCDLLHLSSGYTGGRARS
jgi:alpha-glucosidase